jgi:hypothetical protein
MNERIKELAEQADITLSDRDGWWVAYDEDLERFAELIVEECRNVLTDVYREVPLECSGHLLYADEVIAKHFYGEKE